MTYRGYAEAAAELPCFEYWLRRNISRLPHTRMGRKVSFSDEDIAAIRAIHAQRSGTPDADGRVTRSRTSQAARRAS
jgi:hypothetical protein